MRLALIGAGLALVGGLAAGCGGDDSSNDTAKGNDAGAEKNVTAFCDSNREAGSATDLKGLKSAVGDIEDNLLDDISTDAQAGFDVLKKTVEKAESEKDLATFQKDLSKKELKQIQAYNAYGKKLCDEATSSESPSAE